MILVKVFMAIFSLTKLIPIPNLPLPDQRARYMVTTHMQMIL